jgi:ParB-like chromosome segregation protein Spo0J
MPALTVLDLRAGEVSRPAAAVVRKVAQVRLQDLRLGRSRRERGLDAGHVQVLKELEGRWPPIVVSRADGSVVDGLHRVHAALGVGLAHLPCVFFTGDEGEAYAEFVRLNTAHGLPLSLAERESAAGRILASHPEWSDRRIAATCALAPGTVGRLRCATGPDGQLATRVGRDGRRRPVDHRALRQRIADALRAQPGASLRRVAALVGTSPATVRSVRAELVRAEGEPAQGPLRAVPDHPPGWSPDDALLSTDAGARFATWFGRTAVGDEWRAHLGGIPFGRIYDIADEARRRAGYWSEFARALETRSSRRS